MIYKYTKCVNDVQYQFFCIKKVEIYSECLRHIQNVSKMQSASTLQIMFLVRFNFVKGMKSYDFIIHAWLW